MEALQKLCEKCQKRHVKKPTVMYKQIESELYSDPNWPPAAASNLSLAELLKMETVTSSANQNEQDEEGIGSDICSDEGASDTGETPEAAPDADLSSGPAGIRRMRSRHTSRAEDRIMLLTSDTNT